MRPARRWRWTSTVAGNTLQLVAAVTPAAYYLQISEPPRAVAFTWDTSGSVGPYTNIIYQAFARFTAAIDPQREVVNLLPFGEPGQVLAARLEQLDPARCRAFNPLSPPGVRATLS